MKNHPVFIGKGEERGNPSGDTADARASNFIGLCDDSGVNHRGPRNPYSLGNRDKFRADRQEGFRGNAMSSQFFAADQHSHTAWDVAGAATQGVFRVGGATSSLGSVNPTRKVGTTGAVRHESNATTRRTPQKGGVGSSTASTNETASSVLSTSAPYGHLHTSREVVANDHAAEAEQRMLKEAPVATAVSSNGGEEDAFDVAYRDLARPGTASKTQRSKAPPTTRKGDGKEEEEDAFDF